MDPYTTKNCLDLTCRRTMDVLNEVFSRLPSNWWWPIHPKNSTDTDFLFNRPSFPISYDFMKAALAEGGFISGGRSIRKLEFNTAFAGHMEFTVCKRKGGPTTT